MKISAPDSNGAERKKMCITICLSLSPLDSYVHNVTMSNFCREQTVSVDGLYRTDKPTRSTVIETFFASRMA